MRYEQQTLYILSVHVGTSQCILPDIAHIIPYMVVFMLLHPVGSYTGGPAYHCLLKTFLTSTDDVIAPDDLPPATTSHCLKTTAEQLDLAVCISGYGCVQCLMSV